MGIKLDIGSTKDTIEVISSYDESVTCSEDDYKEYLADLDESRLQLQEGIEPTRFVLKRILDYGAQQKIKNSQVAYTQADGGSSKVNVDVRMGYTMDEIRMCLVDIKNPESDMLKFRTDSDGYAAKDLVALLEQAGINAELMAARSASGKKSYSKKNSQRSSNSASPTPAS